MREIAVEGTFYDTRGWSKRPVIFVDPPHDVALNDWRTQNGLYTKWLERPHPRTAQAVPVLYPSPAFSARFNDGDSVLVKLAVRSDSRGSGMKFVDAQHSSRQPLKRNDPTPATRAAAPVRRVVAPPPYTFPVMFDERRPCQWSFVTFDQQIVHTNIRGVSLAKTFMNCLA